MQSLIFCSLLAAALAGPQQYYRNPYQPYQPQPTPKYYQPPKPYQPQPYQPQPYQAQQQYYSKNYVPIVSESNELNLDGSFKYSYATGDGQQVEAVGVQKNAGYAGQEVESIQGSYSYTAPDGTPIVTTYIADENGFRAEGAHIPTPPPIPEAILRSLAYNEAHKEYEPKQYEPKQYEPKQYEPKPFVQPQQPVYRPFQQQYRPYKTYN